MKEFWTKYYRVILLVAIIIVSVTLIVTCAVLLSEYVSDQERQTGEMGVLHSSETAAHLKAAVATYQQTKIDSLILSLVAPEPENLEAFLDRVRDVRENTEEDMQVKYKYVRFFKDGE